jgi:lysine decarboxylase
MRRPMHEMLQTVSGRLSLHMPASQGRRPFETLDPYLLETTELPVTDDLYHPAGAIREAERLLAGSAGAQVSFLLTGGSTAGVHAMLLYACKRGETVILPRNAHLSALNVCAIAGITPVFADLTELPGGWVVTTPESYAKALDQFPQARAALAVSSDYFGILGDLPAIADAVHAKGKLLLCDEAHGAYFNWREDVRNAGARGADLFVQSAHKTLPAVNASAWLHAMDGIDGSRLRAILRMVQTSSPSFALMQSMDDARAWMDAYGREACERLLDATEAFYGNAAALGFTDDRKAVLTDRLRLVLRAPQGGEWLREMLQAMQIDVETCDTEHIVCILSLLDGQARLNALLDALKRIAEDPTGEPRKLQPLRLYPETWPERNMELSEAVFADTELVKPTDAAGRISAVNVGIYPPGVAWLTAGEAVTEEIASMMETTPAHRVFGLDGGLRCVK